MKKSLILSLILVIVLISFVSAENNITCMENWSCGNWSECTDSQQTRTCTDLNECNTTSEKPEETQTCVADECIENWTCTKWSDCINKTKMRTCTDSNSCETSNEKPPESKDCKPKRLKINNRPEECPDDCVCRGSTVKCDINGGRQMTVYAGKSGNIIVQVKGINMSTQVTLYKENNTVQGVFRNNKTKKIILPDKIREKIKTRIKARLEDEEMELDEDAQYHFKANKRARLFFIIPVKEKVTMQVDAETGEIIKTKNSWWGFLARDMKQTITP